MMGRTPILSGPHCATFEVWAYDSESKKKLRMPVTHVSTEYSGPVAPFPPQLSQVFDMRSRDSQHINAAI